MIQIVRRLGTLLRSEGFSNVVSYRFRSPLFSLVFCGFRLSSLLADYLVINGNVRQIAAFLVHRYGKAAIARRQKLFFFLKDVNATLASWNGEEFFLFLFIAAIFGFLGAFLFLRFLGATILVTEHDIGFALAPSAPTGFNVERSVDDIHFGIWKFCDER